MCLLVKYFAVGTVFVFNIVLVIRDLAASIALDLENKTRLAKPARYRKRGLRCCTALIGSDYSCSLADISKQLHALPFVALVLNYW